MACDDWHIKIPPVSTGCLIEFVDKFIEGSGCVPLSAFKDFWKHNHLLDPYVLRCDDFRSLDWDSRYEVLQSLGPADTLTIPLCWREANPALEYFAWEGLVVDIALEKFESWMRDWPRMKSTHPSFEYIWFDLSNSEQNPISVKMSRAIGCEGNYEHVAEYLAYLLIAELGATHIRITHSGSGETLYEYRQ